jgi:hypothetical protein
MTPFDIHTIFPPFGEGHLGTYREQASLAERHALDFMFEVAEIRYAKPSKFIVATSLYCQPHDADKVRIDPITIDELRKPHPSVRHGNSWWGEYVDPLIKHLDRVPRPWTIRIYLAPDLVFLERFLKHPRVELCIMQHVSQNTIPGMLWRYLPLEEDVTLMARGADAFWPVRELHPHIDAMLASRSLLFRHIHPRDLDDADMFIYRSMPGPIVVKPGLGRGFTECAKSWVWHQMHELWPKTVSLPWRIDEVRRFGLTHWAAYGQDEQFMSHWLYHKAAASGIYTLIDPRYQSQIWKVDRQFVLDASAASTVVEL